MSSSTAARHGRASALLSTLLAAGCASAAEPAASDLVAVRAGAATVRLIDISFNILAAAGASTAEDEELGSLQGGAHDPNQRGFTLQQTELSFYGAVDPYFNAQANLVFVEEGFELEEAFLTTTSLPAGLQLRVGHYLTEFGRINPSHPHAWAWMDQPVINSRVFGGDGTRAPGARLAWLTPLPWYSRLLVGAQNASNESAASFGGVVDEDDEDITVGGRTAAGVEVHSPGDLMWSARWENSTDVDRVLVKGGLSAMHGPNATGSAGETTIYGVDAAAKWVAAGAARGYPFVQLESEFIHRDFDADVDADNALPEDTLTDSGFYAQLLWGFRTGWAVGLRGERAWGSEGGQVPQAEDPRRDDRTRIAPLLIWNPTHFSRLRLQYNYDRYTHLDGLPGEDDTAHSVWLGFDATIGAHPAHGF